MYVIIYAVKASGPRPMPPLVQGMQLHGVTRQLTTSHPEQNRKLPGAPTHPTFKKIKHKCLSGEANKGWKVILRGSTSQRPHQTACQILHTPGRVIPPLVPGLRSPWAPFPQIPRFPVGRRVQRSIRLVLAIWMNLRRDPAAPYSLTPLQGLAERIFGDIWDDRVPIVGQQLCERTRQDIATGSYFVSKELRPVQTPWRISYGKCRKVHKLTSSINSMFLNFMNSKVHFL